MIILGLNIFHADASACLVIDGKIIFASEEERHNRIKHFIGFPKNAIKLCLKKANIELQDIDLISINFNPGYNLLNKILFGLKNFNKVNIFPRIKLNFKKNNLNNLFQENFQFDLKCKIEKVPHHIAHISSSYLASGFNEAVGYSFDGAGDFSTIERFYFKDSKTIKLKKNLFPHSLGILYQSFTQFLGFPEYGDEYKVMGLAAYGKNTYEKKFYEILDYQPGSNFKLDLNYFDINLMNLPPNYNYDTAFYGNIFNKKLSEKFGKPRIVGEKIEQKHMDIAASLQKVFEDIVLQDLNFLHEKYPTENLCLSGGCAFNSSLNGKIRERTKFKNTYIGSNPGDAGGAVGAALYSSSKYDVNYKNTKVETPFLGASYSNDFIKKEIIDNKKVPINCSYAYYDDFKKINEIVINSIENFGVIAWFQDRAEWGPRALGNRSIIADARNSKIKDLLNIKIKQREDFRPFAPLILKEEASKYFIVNENFNVPFMNEIVKAKEITKKLLPGIVHVDGTSRVQTVDKVSNLKIYNLLSDFNKKNGVPLLLNTSFNISEPICNNPIDAIETFAKSTMDYLVMQNWVFKKINL